MKRYSATIFGEGYIGGAQFDTMIEAINACRNCDFAIRFIVYDDDKPVHEEVKGGGWQSVTSTTDFMDKHRPTINDSESTWEPLHLRCKVCGHEWQDRQPTHVPVDAWVAHIQNMQCKNCGVDYKSLLVC